MTFKIIQQPKQIEQNVLDNLDKIELDVKNSGDSKYVKFENGQKAVFEFILEKTKIIFKKWDGSRYIESDRQQQEDKDFKKYYCFVVRDANMQNTERTWDCSNYKAVVTIIQYLKTGVTVLKIKRIGEKKDTIYDIEPIGGGFDMEQQQQEQ